MRLRHRIRILTGLEFRPRPPHLERPPKATWRLSSRTPQSREGVESKKHANQHNNKRANDYPRRFQIVYVEIGDSLQCIRDHSQCECGDRPNEENGRQTEKHGVPVVSKEFLASVVHVCELRNTDETELLYVKTGQ